MIQMNTFNSSSIALKIHISDVRIAKNNILSLEKWKLEFLHKDSSVQLNAENNWWNSLKEDEINFFIWDGNNVSDDQWEGVVDFVPFESAVLINGVMKLSKIVSNNEKN